MDSTSSAVPAVALQELLLDFDSLDDFLRESAALAARVTSPDSFCGITFRRNSSPLTVASSDARAARLDEVQYGSSTGPCLEALSTGAVVHVPDMAREQRWDGFAAYALSEGVRSSLSLPMTIGGETAGACNLYSGRENAFDDEVRSRASDFAQQAAATAMTLALRLIEHNAIEDQLRQALGSRSTIDQAMGIVMGQQRCDVEQAFAILRRTSQNRNVKLRDVATEVVERVSGKAPPAPPAFQQGDHRSEVQVLEHLGHQGGDG